MISDFRFCCSAYVSNLRDHMITSVMSEAVVDRFEPIDIEQDQRHRAPMALVPAPFDFGEREEMPPIEQTRHAVDGCQYLELVGLMHEICYIGKNEHSAAIGRGLQ